MWHKTVNHFLKSNCDEQFWHVDSQVTAAAQTEGEMLHQKKCPLEKKQNRRSDRLSVRRRSEDCHAHGFQMIA